jgi:hypothetical protein
VTRPNDAILDEADRRGACSNLGWPNDARLLSVRHRLE